MKYALIILLLIATPSGAETIYKTFPGTSIIDRSKPVTVIERDYDGRVERVIKGRSGYAPSVPVWDEESYEIRRDPWERDREDAILDELMEGEYWK